MSTCDRCQKPACDHSARGCIDVDCGLIAFLVASRCQAVGLPVTAAGVATIARYLDQERAGNRQANGLVGQVQGIAVHEVQHAA